MLDPRRSRLVPDVDFEKDGKQTGFIRLFHSVHSSAYGFIPIPVVVIRNGAGPTALFVSGNHGDEYEGQIALCNLARTLDPAQITGRVILLPMANFPAGMAGRRTSPIDDGNLNRSFPGDPDGTVTQQIAYFIESTLLPMADLVCDLHSGGSSLMYVPCALMKRPANPKRFDKMKAMLEAFASPLAYITVGGSGTGEDHTLSGGAERLGIPALGTELGGSGTLTPAGLKIAERGLRNLLVHAGILPPSERIAGEAPTRFVNVSGPDHFVYASETGVFEPLVELGDTVQAGQPAARIFTPETPWAPPAVVSFQHAGLVMCKRVPGRTVRGDCLFHLGSD
ncbi:succinylglutamate desuccinylase/aspartoacylase family protein [Limobrevibacterium gyesilva]|uniref:Succinylglutamate desuccinylase/aspartoacylase family protein n=1 Tax=Limobrevibacterium gyesilva TaxID=2991712 RepID=A0AA41YKM7_9PROT|nr:succinylglutamate desuccinylase/aspartoacylase family protein [Limobrevibacterium gyesilva]MCW3475574.1 succinylglutamate desuccinylase/aspartoacylase family protein [Limobrevibacterium gyesilva]